ncbi:hypothetical protein ACFQ07_28210, partial [Actinomadura adrarensis]
MAIGVSSPSCGNPVPGRREGFVRVSPIGRPDADIRRDQDNRTTPPGIPRERQGIRKILGGSYPQAWDGADPVGGGCQDGGMLAEDVLAGLDPEQRAVAEAVQGPVCVLAG